MIKRITDSHAHLGDILYGKNITFKQNVKKRDYHNYLELLENNMMMPPVEYEGVDPVVFDESMLNEEQARNNTATLQNMGKSMDENNITNIWVLPVLPHVSFEEILAASKLDQRIVPFTCADFSLGKDAGKKILEDVKKGAMGLKIHPILQRVDLLSDKVSEVLKFWEETGKPVISHTYCYNYFHPEESYRNAPEYGSNLDFLKLVEKFPNINFVGAHSGGPMDFDQLWDGADLKNLYVDTSFQPVSVVKEFLKRFGHNRVMFGTDWPWGTQATPIKIVKEACENNEELERKIFYENADNLLGG
ncbi:MAG: amidohydrolase family protein [Clostridiales bacterium]|nr:amidohydrolase family protein [Clostridiales bacterium]